MAQMWVAIYGWSAHVQAHVGRIERLEAFFFTRKRIVKLEGRVRTHGRFFCKDSQYFLSLQRDNSQIKNICSTTALLRENGVKGKFNVSGYDN
jgi:hypothetical protein